MARRTPPAHITDIYTFYGTRWAKLDTTDQLVPADQLEPQPEPALADLFTRNGIRAPFLG